MAIKSSAAISNYRSLGNTCARVPFASVRQLGFSLVEVVIALAVIASALLVIFGLLGVGLTSFHQSKAITVSSQIAQQVYSQLESIQFANLVGVNAGLASSRSATLTNPPTPTHHTYFYSANGGNQIRSPLYFDEQGNELNSSTGAVYTVNVDILYPTTLTDSAATVPDVDLATVLIQVAYNPGGVTPAYDAATGAEWTGLTSTGAPMQIANYQFYVNRNS